MQRRAPTTPQQKRKQRALITPKRKLRLLWAELEALRNQNKKQAEGRKNHEKNHAPRFWRINSGDACNGGDGPRCRRPDHDESEAVRREGTGLLEVGAGTGWLMGAVSGDDGAGPCRVFAERAE